VNVIFSAHNLFFDETSKKGQDVSAMSKELGHVTNKFHIPPINSSSESSPGSDSVESAHHISPSLIKFHIPPPHLLAAVTVKVTIVVLVTVMLPVIANLCRK
jgi:hypothetical protein